MCGIAGILNCSASAAPVAPDELQRMCAAQAHRGPDDEGLRIDAFGRCGLAFRRLAIIDLSTGHQPLSNEDGTIWLVFNGEIYNYQSLRAELLAAGHRFSTSSDSEVIVHAFEQWGTACFSRLHGMFAIALWDERNRQLVLARDRLGKKPLVYARFNGRLYFASELKAILALDLPREIDLDALGEYLLLQYIRAPRCIYRGFAKVPPGSFAVVSPDQDAPLSPQSFWTVPPNPTPFRGSYQQALSELDERLSAAVRKRLVSDVPLGAFLSGGIDSSIVVALMSRLGVRPVRTFSIGFADPRYDETRFARAVAEHCGTEHRESIVTPDARELLDTLAFHFDEPFADSSAIPTYCVARHTRQFVTVALTGDGGDEGFSGYDRYRAATLAARLDRIPFSIRATLARFAQRLPHGSPKSASRRAYRFLSALESPPAARYRDWVQVFTPQLLERAFTAPTSEASLRGVREAALFIEQTYDNSRGAPATRATRTDLLSYLPYDLLTKVDCASMACSLECRAPLLDHELIEFARSLPEEWKSPRGGKRILRDWARSLLPPQVLKRRKMGFGVPIGEWFRGPLRSEIERALRSGDSWLSGVFRRDWLAMLLEQHLSGDANHEHRLWSLFMLERWAERWNPKIA